jgi:hypothetical protein
MYIVLSTLAGNRHGDVLPTLAAPPAFNFIRTGWEACVLLLMAVFAGLILLELTRYAAEMYTMLH